MLNTHLNNDFLSVSILCQPGNKICGSDKIDAAEASNLIKQLNSFIPALSDNAICKCYKIDKKSKSFTPIIDPYELAKGIISFKFSFDKDDKYQKNLLLSNTQLNHALLDYIESAVIAIYAEEILCSTDIQPKYQYTSSLESIIEISNTTIKYGIKTFPTFVKSLAKLLKGLNKLNPDYSLLICNNSNHLFANSIETHSSPVPIESEIISEIIGRAIPVYNSTKISHFVFIEHHTKNKYLLTIEDQKASKVLNRAAANYDPVSILANLIEFSDRNRILPTKHLKLHNVVTKSRESREELARSLNKLI